MEINERYSKLYNKAIVTKSNLELQLQQLQDKEERYKHLFEELQQIVVDQQSYERSIDILKNLMQQLSRSQISHLSDLLNTSVATIFFDRQYSIELEVTELRNQNQLKLILHEDTPEGTIVSDINDNGYGLKGVIGFILQCYFILYYHQNPILFLDEAFGNLSSQYLPYLKSLLASLTSKYNFKFVLITHDNRLAELADRTYQVRLGEVKLVS